MVVKTPSDCEPEPLPLPNHKNDWLFEVPCSVGNGRRWILGQSGEVLYDPMMFTPYG